LASPQTFCAQQNATLNNIIINGQNIKWYNSSLGGNVLPNNTQLTNGSTYFASQSNSNCESLRVSVTLNIQNTITLTGNPNQTFCSTQNPTLNDIVVNGTNLNWYSSTSSTNTIPNTTLLVNGTTYYVSQNINSCESINRLAVTVNLINTLNANDYSETICDDLNDGSEIINLTNYNTNLISNISNCTFDYYYSLLGATNQTSSDLISTITNYNLTIGNHIIFVRITSTNGCHQIAQFNLTLVNKPIISITDIVPICDNKSINVDAGLGFDTYVWSNGSTAQTNIISQAGNYSVIVTKNYGNITCSTTKNFSVVQSNVATITNIKTQDWTDTENVITVNTSGFGNYEFSIDGINYQDNNIFTGLNSELYTVYVRDKNGCGIIKDDIFLLMYPKFFTPNSDGYNDTWKIKFSHVEPRLKVNIFDRYGKLLKMLDNISSWDGTYNGNALPSTDYWFVVTREDGKEYRGHFSLKR
jgi:gliding motility-associated-like protein